MPKEITFERRFSGNWVRWEDGHCVHAAGNDDHSPIHTTYPTGYNPECSHCWFGHSHTSERHRAGIV